jgi:hypothetical protein
MKHLFIGGPKDGEWLEIEGDLPYAKVVMPPERIIIPDLRVSPPTEFLMEYLYRAVWLRDINEFTHEEKRYKVFIHEPPRIDLIMHLLKNYRP